MGDCNVFGGFVSGGSGGETTWGQIKGTIQNQTDLQNELGKKVNTVSGKDLSDNNYSDADKEKLSRLGTVFLIDISTDWILEGSIYTQEINVSGIKATDSPICNLILEEDDLTDLKLELFLNISKISLYDNKVKIHCISSSKPNITFQISLKI